MIEAFPEEETLLAPETWPGFIEDTLTKVRDRIDQAYHVSDRLYKAETLLSRERRRLMEPDHELDPRTYSRILTAANIFNLEGLEFLNGTAKSSIEERLAS